MTTRRTVLRFAGALPAAALLGACRTDDEPTTPVLSGELLVVEATDGLSVVDSASGRALHPAGPGAAAWDGSALVTAAGERTYVIGGHGTVTASVDGTRGLTPRVVSPLGAYAALATGHASGAGAGTAAGAAAYRPEGREQTTIMVIGSGGDRIEHTVPGCVEPEAFSSSGEVLYVLDYQPPRQPDTYRVRMVDVRTGQYGPLLTRDEKVIPPGAEEQMRGEGRQAVFAERRKFLFTLYTHQPDHEHTRDLLAGAGARGDGPQVHAFVHTLSLDARFAYCIDLPAPFGESPAHAHAVAISPSTETPFVVDVASGRVAELDPDQLTVRRVASALPPAVSAAAAAAAARTGETLFVAAGKTVHVLDSADLSRRGSWRLDWPALGIVPSRRSDLVWVGQPDAVIAVDPATGTKAATVAVPGLRALRQILR